MKILVVGASGVLGRAVVAELTQRHTVIQASRNQGDVKVDITDPASIDAMYRKIGPIDAVACTAGKVKFAPFADMSDADYRIGLNDKLMGQINLVLLGRLHLAEGGSFTLISGILSESPIKLGTSASMVNGAIDSFVMAAAVDLPRGQRINSVNPSVFQESMQDYAPFFRGFEAIPVARAALAYSRSIEGARTGHVFKVY